MRTEFRGKRLTDGKWVYGDLVVCKSNGRSFITELLEVDEDSWLYWEVAPETVGQDTGILDKDGSKIYEGDCVECVSWNEYFSDPTTGKVMEPFRRRMEVVFMAGGFKLVEHLPQPCKDNVWDMFVDGDLMVMGNIYDNNIK